MSDLTYGVQCPSCKFAFRVKPEWASREGRCPQCKGPIVIPPPPATAGAAAPPIVHYREFLAAQASRR